MPTSRSAGGRSGNTFIVRIINTDRGGWTGVVSHVQTGRSQTFREFIEAVRFIDGFVGAEADLPRETGERRIGSQT